MVKKTHKHWQACRVFPCLFLAFKYKCQITAQYSTLDEKHAFASLAMFGIEYLNKECNFVPTYKTSNLGSSEMG